MRDHVIQRRSFLAAVAAVPLMGGGPAIAHHRSSHTRDRDQLAPEPAPTPETEAEPTSTLIYFPPASIDATGTNDVSAALTTWLASVPNGATADLNSGTYRCETYVRADDRSDLTIRNGTLLRTDSASHGGIVYPQANPHLWLRRAARCRVENITVRGTNTASDMPSAPQLGSYRIEYEFEAAVRLESFTDCAVVGLVADGVWGDGLQAQVGRGLLVKNIDVRRNGRQGIAALASGVVIDGGSIISRRAGIDMEPDSSGQSFGNVKVTNLTLWTWLLAFGSFGPGNYDDVEISHCTINRSGIPVVNADSSSDGRRDRWHVHHLIIGSEDGWKPSSPAPVMRFHRSTGTVVEDNNVHMYVHAQTRNAVGLAQSADATVRNNVFRNAQNAVVNEDGTATWSESGNSTT